MGEVVFLRHQGIRCAVPAHQVTGATMASDGDNLQLFDQTGATDRIARCLAVTTPEGTRPLPCEDARFGTIEESKMLPLSDLLAEELRLPHLVGAMGEDEEIVWLIDLTRWRSNHE